MKIVAKLLIKNGQDFLLMYRISHPTFGIDPDLPGGTAENNDSTLSTMLREVYEEVGLKLHEDQVVEIYAGNDYSKNGTFYSLFTIDMPKRPEIIISWEHSSFEWISKEEFIKKTKTANDTYMHMVSDALASS